MADAATALENGKGAEEVGNTEAAIRHFDRAVRLSAGPGGDWLVGAEATYRKGHALFTTRQYHECRPHLQSYMDQDSDNALGFANEALSFIAIADLEASPDATTISTLSSDAPRSPTQVGVDINPVHQDAMMSRSSSVPDDGGTPGSGGGGPVAFDGRLSTGTRLRTSAGRTYSPPDPESAAAGDPDVFMRDRQRAVTNPRFQRGVSGLPDLSEDGATTAWCCGEELAEQGLCVCICFMLCMISLMLLIGIIS